MGDRGLPRTLSGVRTLIIGSGAREHAIAHSLGLDPAVTEVVVAPGNGGIAQDFPTRQVNAEDPEAVVVLARDLRPDLVVVGPEAPLVARVADAQPLVRGDGLSAF